MVRSSAFQILSLLLIALGYVPTSLAQEAATLPAVGDQAPDFTLNSIDDSEVTLSKLIADGPVVVIVLRGFPGYQCPLCSKQVASLIEAKKAFADKKATVILVYPGTAKDLRSKAIEFVGKTTLPKSFLLVTDPEYEFTNAYGLRWDAPGETAYPSTFVVDQQGKILLAVVSDSHGGRADTKKVISALP
jgi:peroxiredoxin